MSGVKYNNSGAIKVRDINGDELDFPNIYDITRPDPIYYSSNINRKSDGSWSVRRETDHELHTVPVSLFGSKHQGEEYVMTPERLSSNYTYNIGQQMYGEYEDRSDRQYLADKNRRFTNQVLKLRRKKHMTHSPADEFLHRELGGKKGMDDMRLDEEQIVGGTTTTGRQALNSLMGKRRADPNHATHFPSFVHGTEEQYIYNSSETYEEAMRKKGPSQNLPIGRRMKTPVMLPGHPSIIDRVSSIRRAASREDWY